MIYEANYQLYIFLNSIYAGVLAAVTYDVFGILLFGKSRRISLKDAMFWIICAVLMLYFFIVRTDLLFRGYILLGILLGWTAYVLLFSKLVRKIFAYFNDKSAKAINKTADVTKNTANKVKKRISPITKKIKKYLSIPFFEIKLYNKFRKNTKKGDANEKKKKKKKVQ
ncbi:MAG: spore cortex biosynthesis protein YabQ [Eubacteriaceae bacterium]